MVARHTSNTGNLAQQFQSDLRYSLCGGTLGAPLAGYAAITYPLSPTTYSNVLFNLGSVAIGAGTYTLQVYMTNLVSGGAYATYQGITLAGSAAGVVLAPTFSPAAGSYVGPQTVTISSLTTGATIYYTTNGSTPTTLSPNGITPVTVVVPANTNITVKAYAVKSGSTDSSVQSATYSTYTNYTWVNPAGGNWSGAANWSNNAVANGVGTPADFSKLTLGGNATVTLDIPATVGPLIFGDQGNANNWILANGGAGSLTLNNGTNTPAINVLNQSVNIGAQLTGLNGMTKTGPGTLILSSQNNYSGATVVSAGTLQANSPGIGVPNTLQGMVR